MKYWFFYLLTLGFVVPLAAQQSAQPAPTIPPLPPGPLLNRAPNFCCWTIVDQGAPAASSGDVQRSLNRTDDATKPKIIRQSSVVKTGPIICEQLVDDHGRRSQRWHSNGLQFLLTPGGGGPTVFPDVGGTDIYTPNFAVSDFAGLAWISKQTYTGIQNVMGRDCLIFRGEVSPLASDENREAQVWEERAKLLAAIAAQKKGASTQGAPAAAAQGFLAEQKVPAAACIDLASRLPIVASFGPVTRLYQYGTPPSATLVLPPQLAAALQEYSSRMSNLSRLPAAP